MIIYKKTKEKSERVENQSLQIIDTTVVTTTVYFIGIPVYRNKYEKSAM